MLCYGDFIYLLATLLFFTPTILPHHVAVEDADHIRYNIWYHCRL